MYPFSVFSSGFSGLEKQIFIENPVVNYTSHAVSTASHAADTGGEAHLRWVAPAFGGLLLNKGEMKWRNIKPRIKNRATLRHSWIPIFEKIGDNVCEEF